MSSKQDDARLFERNPALHGNLPEVLVQHQQDAGLGFGKIQQDGILPSGAIGPGPKHIMAAGAKGLDDRLREVLVSEQALLGSMLLTDRMWGRHLGGTRALVSPTRTSG
jgi:hypothetical protein